MCFKGFLSIDRIELKTRGVHLLKNTKKLRTKLCFQNVDIQICQFVKYILALERAVNTRVGSYDSLIRPFVKKQISFFAMYNYLFNVYAVASVEPDHTFIYSGTHKVGKHGRYYTVKFDSDDAFFYKFGLKKTTPNYHKYFDHLACNIPSDDFESTFEYFRKKYCNYRPKHSASSPPSSPSKSQNCDDYFEGLKKNITLSLSHKVATLMIYFQSVVVVNIPMLRHLFRFLNINCVTVLNRRLTIQYSAIINICLTRKI
ncbi:hypothetical protein [Mocis latipes granulovirus]|uniref:Uncharacterized protein n=1 Tax=Mocis latipes granulovirus TaxID=2072024 RepID=A0A162GWK7_9BBAC|nr:hypothetical protein [Mocis latipes granulovirus]AKR17493.1 hypothetical protein [Mocis latipes granulovirus]